MKKLMQFGVVAALAALLAIVPTQSRAACTGDCDGSVTVTVNEIISMVNIALGTAAVSSCTAADANGNGEVTIDEIIAAVNYALGDNCPPIGPVACGNGVKEGTEECDNGGVCIGGSNAGTACTADATCQGNGVCTDGPKLGTSCATAADCGTGGVCQKCVPQGGDGCAANCTLERDILTTLKPGVVMGLGIKDGTSGAVVHGDVLTIPLALVGTQTITAGNPRSDDATKRIPYIIKAASVQYPKIAVSTLACACVRGVEYKTCGGTLFEADGSNSTTCTPGFSGQMTCPAEKPCTAVHGTGNSATGFVSCGPDGLNNVDVLLTQDSGGESGIAGKVQIELSGHGPTGSALILNSTAIGTHVGSCPASFCNDNDMLSERGSPSTLPSTTGKATSIVKNANGQDGVDIVDPGTGEPYSSTGAPANCANLLATPPNLSGYNTAGAFPSLGLNTVGDIVVTNNFITQ